MASPDISTNIIASSTHQADGGVPFLNYFADRFGLPHDELIIPELDTPLQGMQAKKIGHAMVSFLNDLRFDLDLQTPANQHAFVFRADIMLKRRWIADKQMKEGLASCMLEGAQSANADTQGVLDKYMRIRSGILDRTKNVERADKRLLLLAAQAVFALRSLYPDFLKTISASMGQDANTRILGLAQNILTDAWVNRPAGDRRTVRQLSPDDNRLLTDLVTYIFRRDGTMQDGRQALTRFVQEPVLLDVNSLRPTPDFPPSGGPQLGEAA